MNTQYIVSTDLDGTLLNHDDYQWEDAREALMALSNYKIPMIINTSKTRSEVATLNSVLPIRDQSYVVENGSAIVLSNEDLIKLDRYKDHPKLKMMDSHYVWVLGEEREFLCHWLYALREKFNWKFEGYRDWDYQTIMAKTGLSLESAIESSKKEFSEPFEWNDTDENLSILKTMAKQSGFEILKGGRFYHLQGNVNKSSLFDFIKEYQSILYPGSKHIQFIALGDNDNDVHMLNRANYAIVIKSPVNAAPILTKSSGVTHSRAMGAKGWNQEILTLLQSFKLIINKEN